MTRDLRLAAIYHDCLHRTPSPAGNPPAREQQDNGASPAAAYPQAGSGPQSAVGRTPDKAPSRETPETQASDLDEILPLLARDVDAVWREW